jgi:pimeloyl-ACP methyl ester carboxylesterase
MRMKMLFDLAYSANLERLATYLTLETKIIVQTPLVMLRGLGRSMRHWLGYENEFARHFKVVTLDLRGIGQSTRPSTARTTIYDMADDVIAVLDHLKFKQAHILGVSLGGMVTLAAGLKHPTRCLSLIAVNTSIAGERTFRLTPLAIRGMLYAAFTKGRDRQRKMVDNLLGPDADEARRQEITSRYDEIDRREGLYAQTAARQLVAAARFSPQRQLRTMRVPTLIVYGTHDLFVSNTNSKKLARHLPHAKLLPLERAGHEVSLDQGEALVRAVQAWVKDLK